MELTLDTTAVSTINSLLTFDIKVGGLVNYYDYFTPLSTTTFTVYTLTTSNNLLQDTLTFSLQNTNIFPNTFTTF